MQSTRTEIYDQPNSDGWWWNETCTSPQYLRPVKQSSRMDYLFFPDQVSGNAKYASKTPGKWQKVQQPIWPTPATEYDKNFGDGQACKCGHPYSRHFDTYEDVEPVGCKYCPCRTFKGEFSA